MEELLARRVGEVLGLHNGSYPQVVSSMAELERSNKSTILSSSRALVKLNCDLGGAMNVVHVPIPRSGSRTSLRSAHDAETK